MSSINTRSITPVKLAGFTILFYNSYFVLYFFRNDVMTFAMITKRIIWWILFCFLCIQTKINFVSRLSIPVPVTMTGTCQSVRVLQSVYRISINQFPRFLQLPTRFSNFYRASFDMVISVIRKIPDRSLDANTRNTTPVKMTNSTIL